MFVSDDHFDVEQNVRIHFSENVSSIAVDVVQDVNDLAERGFLYW